MLRAEFYTSCVTAALRSWQRTEHPIASSCVKILRLSSSMKAVSAPELESLLDGGVESVPNFVEVEIDEGESKSGFPTVTVGVTSGATAVIGRYWREPGANTLGAIQSSFEFSVKGGKE